MALSNGIITAPVTDSDLKTLFGGNNISDWCTASFNKWSMYKPLKNTIVDINSQFDFSNNSWKNDATWWLGNFTGERWGMKFTIEGGIGNISTRTTSGVTYREPTSGFFYNLMRDSLRWTPQKPGGSATSPASPYRQSDFAGYNHNVPCPLPFSYTRTLYVSGATDTRGTYTLDCDIRTPEEVVVGGLNLPIMEPPSGYTMILPNLAQCYVGVLFYNASMDDCFWQCSEVQLEALYNLDPVAHAKALRVSFTDADFTNQYNKNHKDWYTRAFLCSKSLGYCETLVASQGHYLIPCDEAAAICTLAIAGSVVITDYTASKIGTNVHIVVDISNNTGYQQTLTAPKVELITTGTGIIEADYTWSDTTINNGETITLSHTFTGILDNSLNAHFAASYSGGSLDQTIQVVIK
jgi:hypothetical protein